MPKVDEYVLALFFREAHAVLKFNEAFQRRDELIRWLRNAVEAILKNHQATDLVDPQPIAEAAFDFLQQAKGIGQTSDPIAGSYFRVLPASFAASRDKFLSQSSIHNRAEKIGVRFFPDVFDAVRGSSDISAEVAVGIPIPASDRIVTLSHNQTVELDTASTELIEAVETINGLDGDPTFRAQVLGQLKAGRELVRATTLRAYLLYQSVMTVLGLLIEKYKGHAIGYAAQKLLDLLVEHIFKS